MRIFEEKIWSAIDAIPAIAKKYERHKSLGLPQVIRGQILPSEEKDLDSSRIAPKDSRLVRDYIRETFTGVKELDYALETLYAIRRQAVSSLLIMRHAFSLPSSEMTEAAEALTELASDNQEGHSEAIRELLTKLLGYNELPSAVGRIVLSKEAGWLIITFGIAGKPTALRFLVPIFVDLKKELWKEIDTETLHQLPLNVLAEFIPDIKCTIDPGSGSKADFPAESHTCANQEDMRKHLEEAIAYDVRDKIKNIEDISDVHSAADFRAWRMLRTANRNAKITAREEKSQAS